MVDPMRVRAKLAVLGEYRDQLRRLDPTRDDALARYSRRYLVQAGVQVCLDLANHVVADAGWKTVAELREAFTRLEEHDVIDAELAHRLRAMVGMRNRLVHLYDDVDDALVAHAAAAELGDWDAFARAIASYVEAETADGDDDPPATS